MHEELQKFCPNCLPLINKFGQVGVRLDLIRDDYSDCGIDICQCPDCKQFFRVSYKIDQIQIIRYGS